MKTRRFLVLLVCLSLIFSFAGCEFFDTLKDARAEAITNVETMVKEDAYASLDAAAVAKIVETAKNNIGAAATEEGIDKAVANAKNALDKLVLDGVKADAKAALKAYLDLSLFSEANKTLINSKVASASEEIDSCANADAVAEKLAAAKAALDEIKPALTEAKEGATATLDAYVDLDLYSEANQALITAEIANAKAEINELTTVEAVADRLNSAKAAIDALPTALEEAKAAAVLAVEGYITDKTAYTEKGLAEIERIINDAKANIGASDDEAVIDVILEDAKADLDAVLTAAEEYEALAQAFKNSMTSVVGEVVETSVRVEGASVIVDTVNRDATTLYFGSQDGNTATVLDTYITIDYRSEEWSEITIRFRSWDESNNYNMVVKHGSTNFNKTKWENGGKNTVLITKGSAGIQDCQPVHLQIISWGWTKMVLVDGECVFSIVENDFNTGRIYLETWQAGVTFTNTVYKEYASDAELEADYAEELAKTCVNKSEKELLEEAKAAAKEEIASYIQNVETAYSEANQQTIASILSAGETALDSCASIDDVNAAVTAVKAALDDVYTIEEERELADAKAQAKQIVAGHLSDVASNYSEARQAEIAGIISNGNDTIDACTTVEEVAAKVELIKKALNAVPDLNAEANEALIAKKAAAIEEIRSYLVDVNTSYSEANLETISAILYEGAFAISALETADAVDAAVVEIKAALDAVLTIEEEEILSKNEAAEAFKNSLTNVSGDLIGMMSVSDGKLVVDSKAPGVGGNFRFGNQDGNMNKVFDAKVTINYNNVDWSSVTIRFCAWDANTSFKMVITNNNIKIYYTYWDGAAGKSADLLLVDHSSGIKNGEEVHLQILTKGWTKMVVIDGECIFKYWPDKYHVGYTMIETWEAGLVISDPIYKEYPDEASIGAEYGDVIAKDSVNSLVNEIK